MTRDFNFGDHSESFDDHIRQSIPGLDVLRSMVVDLSRTFVQPDTTVLDIGCSTGSALEAVRNANNRARASVRYLGIDTEEKFKGAWSSRSGADISFAVLDACRYDDFKNLSLVTSLFTLQFIPEGN